MRPPVDAIREFEVLTSTYDASFGRNAGGQINVITRSGANRISGSAYEFFRNGALDARNHFAPEDEPAPDYSRHQFGGSIGGPIVRNRTFFFADYERHAAARRRDAGHQRADAGRAAGATSRSRCSPKPFNFLVGQPFPGGVIPPFFQSPIGRGDRGAVSASRTATRRSPTSCRRRRWRDDVDQFDARIDHSFGGGRALTARYSFSDRRLLEPFAGAGVRVDSGFRHRRRRAAGRTCAPTFTHTPIVDAGQRRAVRLQPRRRSASFAENPADHATRRSACRRSPSNPRDAGLSVISIAGFSSLGHEYNNPQESTSDTFQLSDTATWTRGAHLVKFGGEWYGVRQSRVPRRAGARLPELRRVRATPATRSRICCSVCRS